MSTARDVGESRRDRAAPVCACAVLCMLGPAPGLADQDVGRLDDVTVRSRRGQVAAQDVPASIVATSTEELARLGITATRDLVAAVPNLAWQSTEGASVANVFLRGIGSASIHSNQQSPVALVFDDVVLNAPLLAHFDLFDLERVEALRGPQPAETGRMGAGGAVKFVPRTPDPRRPFGGEVNLTVGNQSRADATGALDLPLGPISAARLAVASVGRGGYVRNGTTRRDEGGYRRDAVRLQAVTALADALRVRLTAHSRRFDGDAIRYKQIGLGTPGRPGNGDCPALAYDRAPGNGCVDQTGFADTRDFTENFSGSPNRFEYRVHGGALHLDGTAGGVDVRSITAYEAGASRRAEDTDGGPSYLFASNQQTDSRQWSQEFRLAGGATTTDWLVGLHLFDERARYTSTRRNPNVVLTPALVPGRPIPEAGVRTSVLFGDLDQHDRSAALFGRLSRDLGAPGRVNLELRHVRERKRGWQRGGLYVDATASLGANDFVGTPELETLLRDAVRVAPGPLRPQCPPPFVLTRCYSEASFDGRWDATYGRLTWSRPLAPRVLAYAAVGRGGKGGAISPIARDVIVGVGGTLVSPEAVTSIEAGVKTEWLDRTLRVNVAAFHDRWRDYQLFLSVPTAVGVGPVLTNLPRSRAAGAELEGSWLPAPNWRVDAGVGYTATRVVDVGIVADAQVGRPLPGTPKLTSQLRIGHRWPRPGGGLDVEATWYRAGSRRFDLAGDPVLVEPAYATLGASVRYSFADGRYDLTAWGRNVAGRRWCIGRQSAAGLGTGDVVGCIPNEGEPLHGVTFRASF